MGVPDGHTWLYLFALAPKKLVYNLLTIRR